MNETLLYSLLQGIQRTDPRIHDLLREVIKQIQVINNEVFADPVLTDTDQEDTSEDVGQVTGFTYSLLSEGIRFEWTRPTNAMFFEIRKGSSWDLGSRQLVTSSLGAVLEGQVVGTHTYWIKGIGLDGGYSTLATGLDVIIPALGTITVTGQVIDNSVLLWWTIPTSSFRIDRYIIRRDGSEVATASGNFAVFNNQNTDTYEYTVQAVDIVGNLSAEAAITVEVTQPPDYVLEDVQTSDLTGTVTNVYRDPTIPSLLANVDLTETWEDHFLNNSWDNIQDQIDAGYPYFLQPTLLNGEYEEIFDYGSVFSNVIATISWNFNQIVPTMSVATFLSTSTDNVTYTAETPGVSIFATSLRYVKVRFEFTALN